jgi:hypothetical protein
MYSLAISTQLYRALQSLAVGSSQAAVAGLDADECMVISECPNQQH